MAKVRISFASLVRTGVPVVSLMAILIVVIVLLAVIGPMIGVVVGVVITIASSRRVVVMAWFVEVRAVRIMMIERVYAI